MIEELKKQILDRANSYNKKVELELNKRKYSLCPIFEKIGKSEYKFIGTSVIVNLFDNLFLITAAHVIEDISLPKQYVLIKDEYVNLKTAFNCIKDKNKDLAYLKLDNELSNIFYSNFIPIEQADISQNEKKSMHYGFMGFPKSKVKGIYGTSKFDFTPYMFYDVEVEKDIYSNLNFDQNTHIIINFNQKESFDRIEEKIIPPSPKGISGGSVWEINDLKTPEKNKLAGIGIEYRNKQFKVLICTKIKEFILNLKH